MNCKQAYQHIVFDVSNKEFEKHLSECPLCKEKYSRVNNTMSILDHTIDVQEGILEAILIKKSKLKIHKVRRRNLSGFAQLAAAILIGVFMGHILGKNANTRVLLKNNESLNKHYEMYHLNVDHSEFDFQSFKL